MVYTRVLWVIERIKYLRNWWRFVFPFSRFGWGKIAKVRGGALFFLRDELDFTTLLTLLREGSYKRFDGLKTIVDAGAHIGIYGLFIAIRNPLCSVALIEPDADNFKVLEKNVVLNELKNVKLLNSALSDTVGIERLHFSKHNVGHSIVSNLHMWETGEYRDVETKTLDQFQFEGLKIDVEGAEHKIFRDKIPACKLIVVDIHEVQGESIEALVDRFRQQYEIKVVGYGKVGNAQTIIATPII